MQVERHQVLRALALVILVVGCDLPYFRLGRSANWRKKARGKARESEQRGKSSGRAIMRISAEKDRRCQVVLSSPTPRKHELDSQRC